MASHSTHTHSVVIMMAMSIELMFFWIMCGWYFLWMCLSRLVGDIIGCLLKMLGRA